MLKLSVHAKQQSETNNNMTTKRFNELRRELDSGRSRWSNIVETAGALLIIGLAFAFFLVP